MSYFRSLKLLTNIHLILTGQADQQQAKKMFSLILLCLTSTTVTILPLHAASLNKRTLFSCSFPKLTNLLSHIMRPFGRYVFFLTLKVAAVFYGILLFLNLVHQLIIGRTLDRAAHWCQPRGTTTDKR